MADIIKENSPYAEFARRLRRLREDAGMTRAELAERCGISARTIINYENGTRIPFSDTLATMSKVFGITMEDLMGMDDLAQEEKKAEAMESIRRLYGRTGEKQMQTFLHDADALLAGGTLTIEQQQDFILEMQKLFIIATERARAKYTPKKYRSKEREDASQGRLKEIDRIDAVLTERRLHSSSPDPFLDSDEFEG